MPDRNAIQETPLRELIENVPFGYVTIGDAAYSPTEHLAPIFFGNRSKMEDYDNYNYFASQCCIRIEMAFGLMSMKWGLLQRPLRLPVSRIKFLIVALGRLHNYCINERLSSNQSCFDSQGDAEAVTAYNIPATSHSRDNTPICITGIEENLPSSGMETLRGHSITRELMVRRVANLGLMQPSRSVLYKRRGVTIVDSDSD